MGFPVLELPKTLQNVDHNWEMGPRDSFGVDKNSIRRQELTPPPQVPPLADQTLVNRAGRGDRSKPTAPLQNFMECSGSSSWSWGIRGVALIAH